MAFTGIPAYPYYMPQYQYQTQQPVQQPSNGIIWVSGEAGAKAYMVAPNTTVQLWDSETQRIFLKSADASGMPSMKVLEYTIRDQAQGNAPLTASTGNPINNTDYVTKTELDTVYSRIDALKAQIEKMKGVPNDE